MLILTVTYVRPIAEIEPHIETHMDWVKQGYEKGLFLASGRKVPRTGGIILANGDRDVVEAFLQEDPFVLHGVGVYDVAECAISRNAPGLEALKG